MSDLADKLRQDEDLTRRLKQAKSWCYWGDRFRQYKKDSKVQAWPLGEFVYFVYSPTLSVVKIGYTSDLKQRFHRLETVFARDIVILGAIPGNKGDESAIHNIFNSFRVRVGKFPNETFSCVYPILFFVKHLATIKGVPLMELYGKEKNRWNSNY